MHLQFTAHLFPCSFNIVDITGKTKSRPDYSPYELKINVCPLPLHVCTCVCMCVPARVRVCVCVCTQWCLC